MLTWGFLGCKD